MENQSNTQWLQQELLTYYNMLRVYKLSVLLGLNMIKPVHLSMCTCCVDVLPNAEHCFNQNKTHFIASFINSSS